MTEQEKQALSQALATKYGVEAYEEEYVEHYSIEPYTITTWLHDDWARLMPLAVEQGIGFDAFVNPITSWFTEEKTYICHTFNEYVENHNDKYEAVRIAICRALLEKE